MDLSLLPGNEPLKLTLNRQTAARGLSHAYILAGPQGSGRHTLSKILAAALVCADADEGRKPCMSCPGCKKAMGGIHPDIISVGEPDKDITVAQVRDMRSDAYIRPNEAARKVYMLENAQSMNQSAQNAMLKLLEEGPGYAAFLLLTDNASALLETVRSRCETLSLSPAGEIVEKDATQARDGALELLKRLIKGDELSLFEYALTLEKWDRDDLADLFTEGVGLLRHALVLQSGASSGETDSSVLAVANAAAKSMGPKAIFSAIATLEKLRAACGFNAGTGHVAGWLCAELSSEARA